jgi:hypothetical protein
MFGYLSRLVIDEVTGGTVYNGADLNIIKPGGAKGTLYCISPPFSPKCTQVTIATEQINNTIMICSIFKL